MTVILVTELFSSLTQIASSAVSREMLISLCCSVLVICIGHMTSSAIWNNMMSASKI